MAKLSDIATLYGGSLVPKLPIEHKVDDHFHQCRPCGYQGGFHVTFKKIEDGEGLSVILMCPQCEQTYDIGWKIQTQ